MAKYPNTASRRMQDRLRVGKMVPKDGAITPPTLWLVQAYLVLDLSVNDFGGFRKYIAEIPAFIAKRSGKYTVQGVQPTTIEGEWKPERMVVIEFPEREKAEAFLTDPEIQDLFKMRHDTTTTKLVLADSCT
jgi:uncharacterized protein (DUF1330 family)